MKRLLFLLLSTTVLLSGCASDAEKETTLPSSPDTEISSISDSVIDISESSNADETTSFPDYFNTLVASYDDSAQKYNLSYQHPISKILHEEDDNDTYTYSLSSSS